MSSGSGSKSFTDFICTNTDSSNLNNCFPSQNVLIKSQPQQHSFDWTVPLDELKFICQTQVDDPRAILKSPYFYLGQDVNQICKWVLKIEKSSTSVESALYPQHGLHGGFSLNLVLCDIPSNFLPMVVKAKFSIVDKNSRPLYIYDEKWNRFTRLGRVTREDEIGASVFYTWRKLWLEKDTIAEDDIVRIKLDIIYYGSYLKSKITNANKIIPQLVINDFALNPMIAFRNLLDTENADLIFQCGKNETKEEFLVHRIFISHNSSLLDEMIMNEMEKLSVKGSGGEAENEDKSQDKNLVKKIPRLIFEDLEPKVMEVILKQIYFQYWVLSPNGESEANPENIDFEMADKCLQFAHQYQLEETKEAFFGFFLKKCDGRLYNKDDFDIERRIQMFARLIYLGCKYPSAGSKIKKNLQEVYLTTFSSFFKLAQEEKFQVAKDEFPQQFLDILFGKHD